MGIKQLTISNLSENPNVKYIQITFQCSPKEKVDLVSFTLFNDDMVQFDDDILISKKDAEYLHACLGIYLNRNK